MSRSNMRPLSLTRLLVRLFASNRMKNRFALEKEIGCDMFEYFCVVFFVNRTRANSLSLSFSPSISFSALIMKCTYSCAWFFVLCCCCYCFFRYFQRCKSALHTFIRRIRIYVCCCCCCFFAKWLAGLRPHVC